MTVAVSGKAAGTPLPSKEDHLMTLHQEGPIFVLHLHNKDNRFSTASCTAILKALQIVEEAFLASENPVDMALVTVGDDKFFSNGLDIMHALATIPFMDIYLHLLRRMLTFCIPTVAALNGHAFAGGCLFALAHDYRVMQKDRGFLCMNEVDMPSPLPPGMVALLRCKMNPTVFRNTILQGHRFTAQEALHHNLVDAIVPADELLAEAKTLALRWAHKAKSGVVYKQLKDEMYLDAVKSLAEPYHRLAPKM